MIKYYYENILANQNITSKPNLVWVVDITKIETPVKTFQVFLCLDIYSNLIVAHLIRSDTIDPQSVIQVLTKALKKRFSMPPKTKLIIHTDRGYPFTSQAYRNFTQRFEEHFVPSMSRENTPTDNAVAERFHRTLKGHKVHNMTIQQYLTRCLFNNPDFKNYRSLFHQYVKDINNKENRKSWKISPERHDKQSSAASLLMVEPIYPKAFSKHFGDDFRFHEVTKFKEENAEVVSILSEIAAKRAEIVDKTPFDDVESNGILEVIDERLHEIYSVLAKNPQLTQEYVQQAIQPVGESLNELHWKVDQLLPKNKKQTKKQIQPLRDPINPNLFSLFMAHAGNSYTYQQNLKRAQLRIAYTVLYHVGLRINEIRELTEKDLLDAIRASQLTILQQKQPYIHVLSEEGVNQLKSLKKEFRIVFQEYNFKYLFGKEKPIHQKTLIQLINRDLKHTSEALNIPYNIKSHSFRVNVVSNLLKITTVQNTADIIGHNDIRSTMAYKRYALSPDEIKDLLNQITNN